MKKTQILIIHGGSTFRTRRDYLQMLKKRKVSLEKRKNWAGDNLEKALGKNFQVIRPKMPLPENSRYKDWKIVFEKYIPLLNKEVILMGNSRGGIFLAKYLSEHKFPKKILATFLTCPPFDNSQSNDREIIGCFKLKSDLSLLEKNSPNLILSFSADDDCVPVSHAEKYRAKLKNAKISIYKGMNGHFNTPKFPQIIKMIKEVAKKK